MSEEQITKPEPESVEYKGKTVFTVCGCKGTVVTTEDGKKHFELECKDKQARDELAAILEEEAILRVNPKVVLEELPSPNPDPVVDPTVEPYLEPEPRRSVA